MMCPSRAFGSLPRLKRSPSCTRSYSASTPCILSKSRSLVRRYLPMTLSKQQRNHTHNTQDVDIFRIGKPSKLPELSSISVHFSRWCVTHLLARPPNRKRRKPWRGAPAGYSRDSALPRRPGGAGEHAQTCGTTVGMDRVAASTRQDPFRGPRPWGRLRPNCTQAVVKGLELMIPALSG
jgi:hypothetical protein